MRNKKFLSFIKEKVIGSKKFKFLSGLLLFILFISSFSLSTFSVNNQKEVINNLSNQIQTTNSEQQNNSDTKQIESKAVSDQTFTTTSNKNFSPLFIDSTGTYGSYKDYSYVINTSTSFLSVPDKGIVITLIHKTDSKKSGIFLIETNNLKITWKLQDSGYGYGTSGKELVSMTYSKSTNTIVMLVHDTGGSYSPYMGILLVDANTGKIKFKSTTNYCKNIGDWATGFVVMASNDDKSFHVSYSYGQGAKDRPITPCYLNSDGSDYTRYDDVYFTSNGSASLNYASLTLAFGFLTVGSRNIYASLNYWYPKNGYVTVALLLYDDFAYKTEYVITTTINTSVFDSTFAAYKFTGMYLSGKSNSEYVELAMLNIADRGNTGFIGIWGLWSKIISKNANTRFFDFAIGSDDDVDEIDVSSAIFDYNTGTYTCYATYWVAHDKSATRRGVILRIGFGKFGSNDFTWKGSNSNLNSQNVFLYYPTSGNETIIANKEISNDNLSQIISNSKYVFALLSHDSSNILQFSNYDDYNQEAKTIQIKNSNPNAYNYQTKQTETELKVNNVSSIAATDLNDTLVKQHYDSLSDKGVNIYNSSHGYSVVIDDTSFDTWKTYFGRRQIKVTFKTTFNSNGNATSASYKFVLYGYKWSLQQLETEATVPYSDTISKYTPDKIKSSFSSTNSSNLLLKWIIDNYGSIFNQYFPFTTSDISTSQTTGTKAISIKMIQTTADDSSIAKDAVKVTISIWSGYESKDFTFTLKGFFPIETINNAEATVTSPINQYTAKQIKDQYSINNSNNLLLRWLINNNGLLFNDKFPSFAYNDISTNTTSGQSSLSVTSILTNEDDNNIAKDAIKVTVRIWSGYAYRDYTLTLKGFATESFADTELTIDVRNNGIKASGTIANYTANDLIGLALGDSKYNELKQFIIDCFGSIIQNYSKPASSVKDNDFGLTIKSDDNSDTSVVITMSLSNSYQNNQLTTKKFTFTLTGLNTSNVTPVHPDSYSDTNLGGNDVFVDLSSMNLYAFEAFKLLIENDNQLINIIKDAIKANFVYKAQNHYKDNTYVDNIIASGATLTNNESLGMSNDQINTFYTEGKLPDNSYINNKGFDSTTANITNSQYNFKLTANLNNVIQNNSDVTKVVNNIYFYGAKELSLPTNDSSTQTTLTKTQLGISVTDVNKLDNLTIEQAINNYNNNGISDAKIQSSISITNTTRIANSITITYTINNHIANKGDNTNPIIVLENLTNQLLTITDFDIVIPPFDATISTSLIKDINLNTTNIGILVSSQQAQEDAKALLEGTLTNNLTTYFTNAIDDEIIIRKISSNNVSGTITIVFAFKNFYLNGNKVQNNSTGSLGSEYIATISGYITQKGFSALSNDIPANLLQDKYINEFVKDGTLSTKTIDFKTIIKQILLDYLNDGNTYFETNIQNNIIQYINSTAFTTDSSIEVNYALNANGDYVNGQVKFKNTQLSTLSGEEIWKNGYIFNYQDLMYQQTSVQENGYDILTNFPGLTFEQFKANPTQINVWDLITINNAPKDNYTNSSYASNTLNATIKAGVGNNETGLGKIVITFTSFYTANGLVSNYAYELPTTYQFKPVKTNVVGDILKDSIDATLLSWQTYNSANLYTYLNNTNNLTAINKTLQDNITSLVNDGIGLSPTIYLNSASIKGNDVQILVNIDRYQSETITITNLAPINETNIQIKADLPADLNVSNMETYFNDSNKNALAQKFLTWDNSSKLPNNQEIQVINIKIFNIGFNVQYGHYLYINFYFNGIYTSNSANSYQADYVYQARLENIPEVNANSSKIRLVRVNNVQSQDLSNKNKSSFNLLYIIPIILESLIALLATFLIIKKVRNRKGY